MSPRFAPSELFLKAQTDERLLALAAQGHGRAFAVLVERRRGALLAHAQRMVGVDRAEDVLQQTLLRAWSSLQRGQEVRHVQAWLHRIVHNASLSEIERQVQATSPLDEQLPDRASVVVDAEQRFEARQVLEGLATLPERQRLALLGTELEGRSRRELAAELGLSEGAVRQLVHRARAGVRAAVAVVVPLPLLTRLMKGGGWLPGPDAASGLRPGVEAATASSLMVGGAAKAGTALLAVGAFGGGLLLHGGGTHRHRHTVLAGVVDHRDRPAGSASHAAARHVVLIAAPAASPADTGGPAVGNRLAAPRSVLVVRTTPIRSDPRAGHRAGDRRPSALHRPHEEGASSPTAPSQESRPTASQGDGGGPSSQSGTERRTGTENGAQTSPSDGGGWTEAQTLASGRESSDRQLSDAGGSSAGGSGDSRGRTSDGGGGSSATSVSSSSTGSPQDAAGGNSN